MNRHPNIAFFNGIVIIAIMVMAAFANVAKQCSGMTSLALEPSVLRFKTAGA